MLCDTYKTPKSGDPKSAHISAVVSLRQIKLGATNENKTKVAFRSKGKSWNPGILVLQMACLCINPFYNLIIHRKKTLESWMGYMGKIVV